MKVKLNYVANQVTPEGLDEVQRMILAYKLGQHVAFSGSPGTGKTNLVVALPKIVQRPLFDTTCDTFMTESPLVGAPELSGSNGATVTVWNNGIASAAAEQNGIFYGDEFDLLPGSVQKRLNSLFDDRRSIRRRDGKEIKAGDNFFGVVSYNPSDKASKRELEESVADRFVHFNFNYLPPSLEASVALGDLTDLVSQERGLILSEDSLRFVRRDANAPWEDFFTKEKIKHSDNVIGYLTMEEKDKMNEVLPKKLSRKDLAYRLADFFVTVRSFADKGTNDLKSEIKNYLREIGEVTNVLLHKPSVRILRSAIAQYDFLVDQGMNPQQAQSYASRLCVDQITYGKFGARPLGTKVSTHEAVVSLAQFYDLMGKPRQATNFGA